MEVVRGHVARMKVLEMVEEKRLLQRPRLLRPVKIQNAWRSLLARRVADALRAHIRAEFLMALRLQLAWYRRQGNFSTFVLLGCLREQDQDDKDLRKLITKLYRRRNAKAAVPSGEPITAADSLSTDYVKFGEPLEEEEVVDGDTHLCERVQGRAAALALLSCCCAGAIAGVHGIAAVAAA